MNQKDQVFSYIKQFGSITPMEAFRDLGITKLATVVSDMIREDHIQFNKEFVTTVNRLGHRTMYMKYSFPEEKKIDE